MASETQTAALSQSVPAIIKVAIVEDQRDIREGLASLIKYTDGYQCTGSYCLARRRTYLACIAVLACPTLGRSSRLSTSRISARR